MSDRHITVAGYPRYQVATTTAGVTIIDTTGTSEPQLVTPEVLPQMLCHLANNCDALERRVRVIEAALNQ